MHQHRKPRHRRIIEGFLPPALALVALNVATFVLIFVR